MLSSLILKSNDDSNQNSCVKADNYFIKEIEFKKLEQWYSEQKTEIWSADEKIIAADEIWWKNNELNDWHWILNLKRKKLIFILNVIK